jgi:plastocyanin
MSRRGAWRWGWLLALGFALGGALALPAGALGASAQVQVGDFSKTGAEFTAFYPNQAVVHVGDKVKFSIVGFHTVVFPKKGASLPPLVVPDGPNAPTADPAGRPYWWSGVTPQLNFNPALAAPSGGKAVTGAKTVNSGVPQGKRPSFTFSFPKAGTYEVRCAVHPNMRGSVKVVPQAARLKTPSQVKATVRKEKAADAKTAASLAKTAPAKAGPTDVIIGPGNARMDILGFFPSTRTVPVNSTVTFRMGGREEIHTATFGPQPFLEAVAKASFEGNSLAIGSEGAYPSDPPQAGPPPVTPTAHGNCFVNSGVLFDPGVVKGQASSFTFRFSTPGTYQFLCLIHTDMKGTIVVTP